MDFKERLQKYKEKKGISGIISDAIFVLLVVGMIIPSTRQSIMVGASKIRSFLIPASIQQDSDYGSLKSGDYQWQLTDLDGNTVQLADLKGKTIFVNFWATWCPPCIAELPDMQGLYDKYGADDRIVFLFVSNEEATVLSAFLQKKGYRLPVYIARTAPPEVLQTSSIPTTFLIDKTGTVRTKHTGAANWDGDGFVEKLENLLAKK